MIALGRCGRLSRSMYARSKSSTDSRVPSGGGEIAVGPEACGFLRVRMRIDVAALAGERARHRMERDDPHVARRTARADQLLRDLLALDELAEPIEAGRERHLDLGLGRAEE